MSGINLEVQVYPVGVLEAYKHRRLKKHLTGYVWTKIKKRDFHAVRMSFNGYLAEPYEWPPGAYPKGRKCGKGWTELRALIDLRDKIAKRNDI